MALKSMPLNKDIKNDALHAFYVKVKAKPEQRLTKMENDLALKIYNLIYGPHKRKIANLPERLFEAHNDIPMSSVTMLAKKGKRKKGSIEPSERTTYHWRRFQGVHIDGCWPMMEAREIRLKEHMPQCPGQMMRRYSNEHLDVLLRYKFITKEVYDACQAEYIKACELAKEIYEPVEQAVKDVGLILRTCKTTKGLRDAWPEVEQFLKLPQQTAGPLIAVDIVDLTARLKKMGVKQEQERASA